MIDNKQTKTLAIFALKTVKLLQLKSKAFVWHLREVNKIVPKLWVESLLTHHMWGETWHIIELYLGFGILTLRLGIDFKLYVYIQ